MVNLLIIAGQMIGATALVCAGLCIWVALARSIHSYVIKRKDWIKFWKNQTEVMIIPAEIKGEKMREICQDIGISSVLVFFVLLCQRFYLGKWFAFIIIEAALAPTLVFAGVHFMVWRLGRKKDTLDIRRHKREHLIAWSTALLVEIVLFFISLWHELPQILAISIN